MAFRRMLKIQRNILTFFYLLHIITHRINSMREVSELEQVYLDTAKVLKAISDPKRLRIVDMLSCGELCACKILEEFHITQPTLSHDMKVLIEAKIVNDRRDGKNIYYSLNKEQLDVFEKTIHDILSKKSDCICNADGCCN